MSLLKKIAKGIGYEVKSIWYEDHKSDEFTTFQAFLSFWLNGYQNEELFITSGCSTFAISLTKKEVLANRQFNITDT